MAIRGTGNTARVFSPTEAALEQQLPQIFSLLDPKSRIAVFFVSKIWRAAHIEVLRWDWTVLKNQCKQKNWCAAAQFMAHRIQDISPSEKPISFPHLNFLEMRVKDAMFSIINASSGKEFSHFRETMQKECSYSFMCCIDSVHSLKFEIRGIRCPWLNLTKAQEKRYAIKKLIENKLFKNAVKQLSTMEPGDDRTFCLNKIVEALMQETPAWSIVVLQGISKRYLRISALIGLFHQVDGSEKKIKFEIVDWIYKTLISEINKDEPKDSLMETFTQKTLFEIAKRFIAEGQRNEAQHKIPDLRGYLLQKLNPL